MPAFLMDVLVSTAKVHSFLSLPTTVRLSAVAAFTIPLAFLDLATALPGVGSATFFDSSAPFFSWAAGSGFAWAAASPTELARETALRTRTKSFLAVMGIHPPSRASDGPSTRNLHPSSKRTQGAAERRPEEPSGSERGYFLAAHGLAAFFSILAIVTLLAIILPPSSV